MTRKGFDVAAFIKGVELPTRVVQLCTDAAVRTRMDELMAMLDALPKDDGALAGNPQRDALLDELRAIQEDDSTWTAFTVKAPTHQARTEFMVALAAQESVQDAPESARRPIIERTMAAEATMLAACLTEIDGHAVKLSDQQARQILAGWPDDLTRELIEAINDLGAAVVSVPFSRRVSETLATPEPSNS